MSSNKVRLIDANALIDSWNKVIKHMVRDSDGASPIDFALVISDVSKAPTIDPESLRPHGKWLLEAHKESTNYRWNVTVECSNCCDEQKEIWAGFFPNVPDWLARDVALDSAASVKLSNYCPNCGAKMEVDNV